VSITVQPQVASLVPGRTMAVRAIGHDADDSTADITSKVVFEDDSAVARIFQHLITARDPGAVAIRAVTKSGSLTSDRNLALAVSPIVALELDPTRDGLRLGDSIQWTARATLANGATRVNVTPRMDWSSSDTNAVHIGARNKRASPRRAAPAPRRSRRATRRAAPRAASRSSSSPSSRASPSNRRRASSSSTSRPAFVRSAPSRAATRPRSRRARWASADEAIARIDKSGVVTPLALGVVELGALDKTSGIASDDAGQNGVLAVVGGPVSSAVDPAELELGVGETERLRALRTYEGATGTFRRGGRADWFTSDPGVASVDGDAGVACLAAGTATLSARGVPCSATKSASLGPAGLTVTVSPPASAARRSRSFTLSG
jgi:hypothetical protein